jgi:uncharacterized protein (DUF2236 family)
VSNPALGFTGPGSLSWRVGSELVLHLAGPRALLMQFAHPMVAQGVADHSRFREDLLGRTRRTFGAVYRMLFGDVDSALAIARAVHEGHSRVRGSLPVAAGRHAAGAPYAANEPRLLAWVWATLVDSGLWAYERWVAPLATAERERWYEENFSTAALFGLGADDLPVTYLAFRGWMDDWLAGDELAVSPTGQELARVFLQGAGWPGLGSLFTLLSAGTLPPRLRDEFGLRWDLKTRAAFAAFSTSVHVGARLTPRPLRLAPHAWGARLRLMRAG